jgi:hypothetical protein
MTNFTKTKILGRRLFVAKNKILKKKPKLLDNNKLAKRRAKPDPLEACISQSEDLEKCVKIIGRNKS